MISQDRYKNELIKYFQHKSDNKMKRKEKISCLEQSYTDEYLNRIISDTYEFTKYVLSQDTVGCGFCSLEVDNIYVNYIGLGLIDGKFADKLYYYGDYIVSERILKDIFGKQLTIEIKGDIYAHNKEERKYLFLSEFPKDVNQIKDSLFGKSKVLK